MATITHFVDPHIWVACNMGDCPLCQGLQKESALLRAPRSAELSWIHRVGPATAHHRRCLSSSFVSFHVVVHHAWQWYELRRDDYADDTATYKAINVGLNAKGELLIIYYVYPGPVFAAKFTPDEMMLISQNRDVKEVSH